MKKTLCLLLLMTSCLMSSGCVTLGPVVKTEFVILKPGKPVIILDNQRVKVKPLLGEGGLSRISLGGWVAMPQEHFEALKRAAEN